MRRCEKIGFQHNMSHKIIRILRKMGVGFEAFSVLRHFFTPSEGARSNGLPGNDQPQPPTPMTEYGLNEETLASGRIFPPEVENRYGVGYHGTTTYHAESIENSGFKPFKAFTDQEWTLLQQLGRAFGGRFLEPAIQFQEMTRVNFFIISGLALHHTKWRGGQGLSRYIKPLVEAIIAHPNLSQNTDEARFVRDLLARMRVIEEGRPVVYAVCLDGQTDMEHNLLAGAVQVTGTVSADRIIAKLNAENFTKYDSIDAKRLSAEARTFRQPRIGHFVRHLPIRDGW
jgi:hypothetical protein